MIYKGNPEVYSCYSPRLHDYLEEQNIYPFDEFNNVKNRKRCWIYEVNNELSKFLTLWSENKR